MFKVQLNISEEVADLVRQGDELITDQMCFCEVIVTTLEDEDIFVYEPASGYPGDLLIDIMESAIYLMNGCNTECLRMGGHTWYRYFIVDNLVIVNCRREHTQATPWWTVPYTYPLDKEITVQSNEFFPEIYRSLTELVEKLICYNPEIFKHDGTTNFYTIFKYFVYVYEHTYLTKAHNELMVSNEDFVNKIKNNGMLQIPTRRKI